MDKQTKKTQWVKFFNASGIPSPAAATYAHIFVENRIQIDMLMDLNKEYLREMGITLMGDIIAILRHAKSVSEQTARDKVLNTESIALPIAAIPANPVSPPLQSAKKKSIIKEINTKNVKSAAAVIAPLPKPARRVLPEHEGKYKIKLPTGCTERSKDILAKRAKLYSDREDSGKSDVFQRLSNDMLQNPDVMHLEGDNKRESFQKNTDVKIRITGFANKKTTQGSSSIFERLGEKKEEATISMHIKPILKNSSKSVQSSGIVKAKNLTPTTIRSQKQKVLLVKKIPIKGSGDSDVDDDYFRSEADDLDNEDMIYEQSSSSDKMVKFASTAEVREIVSEPHLNTSPKRGKIHKGNIKSRLDLSAKLRNTKRSFNLKSSPANFKGGVSPIKGKSLRLKSDDLLFRQDLPVHQRLGNTSSSSYFQTNSANVISVLSKRIGSVNITAPTQRRYSLQSNSKQKLSNSSSVFDRLGFSK